MNRDRQDPPQKKLGKLRKPRADKEKEVEGEPQPQIKRRLESLGWTMEQLAEATGESQQQVSKVITGRIRLRVDHAIRWGKALGVSPASLMKASAVIRTDAVLVEPARAIGTRTNAPLYQVTADSVSDANINVGDLIQVAPEEPKTGDVVLAAVSKPDEPDVTGEMLFAFHAPCTYLTNTPGGVVALRSDDPDFSIRVIGVVIGVLPRRPEGDDRGGPVNKEPR
jgi:transcriptional regulator with XRE-family HTH domain